MVPIFTKSEKIQKINENPVGHAVFWILLKLYTIVGMGWCLAPLALLTLERWWAVYKASWLFGFVLWLPWPLYKPLLKSLLLTKSKSSAAEKSKSQ